jgi:serine/threonine protein kinase
MSRHRGPDLSGTRQLEDEAGLLGNAVPDALAAELLSRSDIATVYRVVGADLNSMVVKLVDPDVTVAVADTYRRLGEHPGVTTLRRTGNGYLVFAFHAQSLADRLDAGPIPAIDLADLLTPVAAALDQLHRVGIVHADVKPSNIMLSAAGTAVLTDLESAAGIGTIPLRVTVGFCPPEQLTGQPLTIANDTYSFTSTVLTALTGSTAWMADPAGWFGSAAATRLPPQALTALRLGLAADPSGRQSDPERLLAALAGATPPPANPMPVAPMPVRRQPITYPEPEVLVGERQVLNPATADPPLPTVYPAVPTPPVKTAEPQLTELAAAAQQVWGFVDLRAVTVDRLALQLQPPEPELEVIADERSIWRHPAMIASIGLAVALVLLAICLMILG